MADKRPMPQKIRPNVKRQMILVALALGGIGIGYGLGFVFKKDPPKPVEIAESVQAPGVDTENTEGKRAPDPKLPAPSPILPEIDGAHDTENLRAYEEALPDNIVEGAIPTIVPVEPTLPPPPLPQQTEYVAPEANGEDTQAAESELKTSTPPVEQASVAPAEQAVPPQTIPAQPSLAAIRTWQINALPFESDDRPQIAIVIDDMGVDRARSELAVALPPPLTMSYLTYGKHLETQTTRARQAGHELLMHIPMEPSSTTVDPGPNVLLSGMEETELLHNLRWNLDQFSGYVGVNNHMGSRFTSDFKSMASVMKELNNRGLMFLDSLTSAKSQGSRAARSTGIPHLTRNVFLDHEDDLDAINRRLRDTERLALRQGHAIAIGHPRDNTLAALTVWLNTVEEKGFQLVPLTALLKPRQKTTATAD